MKTYELKGKAINLFIKAESEEAAKKIIFAPLAEVAKHITKVWFEKNI